MRGHSLSQPVAKGNTKSPFAGAPNAVFSKWAPLGSTDEDARKFTAKQKRETEKLKEGLARARAQSGHTRAF